MLSLVVLFNVVFSLCFTPSVLATQYTVAVGITEPLHYLDDTFLSTTTDISQLVDQTSCNLTSERIINMARPLKIDLMRVGGTRGDATYYDLSENATLVPPPPYTDVLTKSMWDDVNAFAQAIGMNIVFGVNAGVGPRSVSTDGKSWTADNFLELLNYTMENNYPVVGYEFSNEPNLFFMAFGLQSVVSGAQLGEDFKAFHQVVKSANSSLLAIGIDVAYVPLVGEIIPEFYSDFLEVAGNLLDVMSWHFYPLFSSQYDKEIPPKLDPFLATPSKVLDPLILDQVGFWGSIVEDLARKYAPQAQVWLGETGSAVGGGQYNVSNAFADGFEYLDKIGQMGGQGQQLIFRQTLCNHAYALIAKNLNGTYTPNPSYFTTLLFKQLVGNRALETVVVDSISSLSTFRAYSFCSRASNYWNNSHPVLLLLNLRVDASIDVSFAEEFSLQPLEGPMAVWIFTANSLTSTEILVNDQLLAVDEDGNPPNMLSLAAIVGSLSLPPTSYAFVLFPNTTANACE